MQLGPYTTERTVAQSDRFAIYQARRGDEVVALKVLADKRLAQRFTQMMHLATLLEDPHTVRVLDAGVGYAALELVDGPNLKATILRGPLPPAAAIAIIRQLCAAIAAAHAAGIIHGRLSPPHLLHVLRECLPKSTDPE